ncbi:MAG: hypothetical protein AUJ57_00620 [Zetaproteobacteria bacterium CG1_02_53_45]|nr:MAG: hypothetical protein AUJ57_00620 [Zetaproteobacteria bacterium CG1_02_53_45]
MILNIADMTCTERFIRKLLICGLLLTGCSIVQHPLPEQSASPDACRSLFLSSNKAIEDAGVRDAGSHLLPGFPYLRTTRFYASFRDQVDNDKQFSTWVGQLARLDVEARTAELLNLPSTDRPDPGGKLEQRLNDCRIKLLKADTKLPASREKLRKNAQVPDDYLTWQRIIGLYPLTSLFVSAGIVRWHNEERLNYATPSDKLPIHGNLVRWSSQRNPPLTSGQVQEILQQSVDPLGIPGPDAGDLDKLFNTFAPTWEVDVVDNNDQIGSPKWLDGKLSVDTGHPSVFHEVSYARLNGKILLQLNYIIWFPARASHDIYGGIFDGINWRVTLGRDGKPWMYDSIHNCGCYQKFFPGRHLRLRSDLPTMYFEKPLVPQAAPENDQIVLRIAHMTHYIQRLVYLENPQSTRAMAWHDYNELRALPAASGHRSIFNANGIVSGSERSERFILWPMGVRSSGAMRQWGKHNTAFVGKRHFDDPNLIESLFDQVEP